MASPSPSKYQPKERVGYQSHVIDNKLYMWGGIQKDLPGVHNDETKLRITSRVEVMDLMTGEWSQHQTKGNPPLGVWGYASAVVGRDIYYFGGGCGHNECYHNSLYCLNVDSWTWREIASTNDKEGPMMKHLCGMAAIKVNGEDHLLVIGGIGPPTNTPQQVNARYIVRSDGRIITNEHHYYNLVRGKWISVSSNGDIPPPSAGFSLTSLTANRVLLHNAMTNGIYIGSCCNESCVNWEKISQRDTSAVWPKGRTVHTTALMRNHHIIMIGGTKDGKVAITDSWIFDINNKQWEEFPLPQSVTGRRSHSLSVWRVNSSSVWLIIFGGMDDKKNPIIDTSIIDMSWDGRVWSVGGVTTHPFEDYQRKLIEKLIMRESIQPSSSATIGERELQQLQEEKELMEGRLQHEIRQQERAFQQQLDDKQQQLDDKQQQIQNQFQQIQNQQQLLDDKQQQIQNQHQQLDDKQQQLQNQQQQLDDKQQQIENHQQEIQNQQQQLDDRQQQIENHQQEIQNQQQQLDDRQQQIHNQQQQLDDRQQQVEELRGGVARLEGRVRQLESSWIVRRDEITITDDVIGRGGWGTVSVAHFRGTAVAAKCLYDVIISPYNIAAFTREMEIASRVRHPNLLQFIGATREGSPVILCEIMATSLRKQLENNSPLPYPAILTISHDVACGLNYLHLFHPHPILHRDVSSANVLLQFMGNGWRAKVSDYGSANLQSLIGTTTNPGNPVYSAPEADRPNLHSPAMDVYSYGVLVIEMMVRELPEVSERRRHINSIRRPAIKGLIERCIRDDRTQRPSMNNIISELNETI